ncbi:unnamed protein product [Nezara viridula]|uniref:Uncharacterized protein n=1 Tax=Nezara viridula TaxID=85310 RepID=A0A9P0E610_NEZVI|nr:unnamed protein product [Nezara viridula]
MSARITNRGKLTLTLGPHYRQIEANSRILPQFYGNLPEFASATVVENKGKGESGRRWWGYFDLLVEGNGLFTPVCCISIRNGKLRQNPSKFCIMAVALR